MNHELRAMVAMLDALKHELRAASFIANRAPAYEIQDEWRKADSQTYEAIKAVQHDEQEAEASGREDRLDTSHLT